MDEEDDSPNTLSTTRPLLRSHQTTPPNPFAAILAILANKEEEEQKQFMVLEVIWNLAFVLVSLLVLFSTFHEKPSTPLRAWISGYAFQCVLHVGFVCFDDRRTRGFSDLLGFPAFSLSRRRRTSMMNSLESVQKVMYFIWWMFGFYWTVVGGQSLRQDSPYLYWLTVIFLAFDVFFIMFCVGMVFLIFFALFFCILIIVFIIVKNGASEDDIRTPRAQVELVNDSYINEFGLNADDLILDDTRELRRRGGGSST